MWLSSLKNISSYSVIFNVFLAKKKRKGFRLSPFRGTGERLSPVLQYATYRFSISVAGTMFALLQVRRLSPPPARFLLRQGRPYPTGGSDIPQIVLAISAHSIFSPFS